MENVILIHHHLEVLPMIMAVKRNIEEGGLTIILMKRAITVTKDITKCTALVVGSDDVAPSHRVGVLTRRQSCRREGSRGIRVIASY